MSSKTNQTIKSKLFNVRSRVRSYQVSINKYTSSYASTLGDDQYTILAVSVGIICSFFLFISILEMISSLNPAWIVPFAVSILGIKISWKSINSVLN